MAQATAKKDIRSSTPTELSLWLSFVVPDVVPEPKTAVMVPNMVLMCGAKFSKEKQVSGNTPSDLH